MKRTKHNEALKKSLNEKGDPFNCPNCQKQFIIKAPVNYVGGRDVIGGQCPHCRVHVTVNEDGATLKISSNRIQRRYGGVRQKPYAGFYKKDKRSQRVDVHIKDVSE